MAEYVIGALAATLGAYLGWHWKDIRDWFVKNYAQKEEDGKNEDERSEDKKNEDERSKDERNEDERNEDEKNEDEKNEDERNEDERNENERNEDERNLVAINEEGKTKVWNFTEGMVGCMMKLLKDLNAETFEAVGKWVHSLTFTNGVLFAGGAVVAVSLFTGCLGGIELPLNEENLVMVKLCFSSLWMIRAHAQKSISDGLEKDYMKEKLAELVADIYEKFHEAILQSFMPSSSQAAP